MKEADTASVCPASRHEWRKWLQRNHEKKESVWLICYKKEANVPTINWSDAVEEALCFGWIDSVRKTVDAERFKQRFSKRKPKSMWSKINKQKVKVLIKQGLMTGAGLKAIEVAKRNGAWTFLDDVEEMVIPKDLEDAFKKKPGSKKYFLTLSRSAKRIHLASLVMAKRPETRIKRITEIIAQMKA